MRALVTGAAGFVGFAVAAAMVDAGYQVVGLTRSGRPLPDGVQRAAADVTDAAALRAVVDESGAEVVCHLAALTRVRDAQADPLSYWRTNVGGTLAVLDALTARAGPPARLVVASTCAVYGKWLDQPATEDMDPRPEGTYAVTKLAADQAVADVAATGAIGAISVRSYNVAGGLAGHRDTDETRLIPKVVAVAQGRADELGVNGDGSVVRDFVHVADMAAAFVLAVDVCKVGEWRAYNVGSGLRSSIADVVAAAEAVTGKPLPIRHNPPADEPAAMLADPSRIRAELGWRPERSTLPQIIGDALAAEAYSGAE